MEGLFSSVTLFFLLGLAAGLVGFTLLYKKVDIPGFFKEFFHLNTRVKSFLFIILFGVALAFCLALLMDVARLGDTASQVVEGLSVGFMCSMLPTLLGIKTSSNSSGSKPATKNSKSSSGGGRRSKG